MLGAYETKLAVRRCYLATFATAALASVCFLSWTSWVRVGSPALDLWIDIQSSQDSTERSCRQPRRILFDPPNRCLIDFGLLSDSSARPPAAQALSPNSLAACSGRRQRIVFQELNDHRIVPILNTVSSGLPVPKVPSPCSESPCRLYLRHAQVQPPPQQMVAHVIDAGVPIRFLDPNRNVDSTRLAGRGGLSAPPRCLSCARLRNDSKLSNCSGKRHWRGRWCMWRYKSPKHRIRATRK